MATHEQSEQHALNAYAAVAASAATTAARHAFATGLATAFRSSSADSSVGPASAAASTAASTQSTQSTQSAVSSAPSAASAQSAASTRNSRMTLPGALGAYYGQPLVWGAAVLACCMLALAAVDDVGRVYSAADAGGWVADAALRLAIATGAIAAAFWPLERETILDGVVIAARCGVMLRRAATYCVQVECGCLQPDLVRLAPPAAFKKCGGPSVRFVRVAPGPLPDGADPRAHSLAAFGARAMAWFYREYAPPDVHDWAHQAQLLTPFGADCTRDPPAHWLEAFDANRRPLGVRVLVAATLRNPMPNQLDLRVDLLSGAAGWKPAFLTSEAAESLSVVTDELTIQRIIALADAALAAALGDGARNRFAMAAATAAADSTATSPPGGVPAPAN